jgi:glycosyltransferase involved in cell wall biosynthesis
MRFVYTVHSDAVKENSTWDKRFFRLKRFCFRQRWILPITISPSSKISFDKLYGMESLMVINGIKKNPNVVQSNVFNRYRHTNNTTILFHPARITEAKNQVMLCESVQQLINEGWDIVLIIAGVCQDEMIFDQLKKYFSDRIVYLGERRDVINLLCESDVMCLSSIWEGLPISLLEAMSVGSVPICTPVGGIPDVISSGYNGFVSKSVSVQDYKDAILEYINLDTKSKQQLKMNVIKSFQDYDIINVNDKYLNIYRS